MENNNVFALLVSIGNYELLKLTNLPTYYADLQLIGTAILNGLNVPNENIRAIIGSDNNGLVSVISMLKALAEFAALLKKDDTFIFYFSGHGANGQICFSDGAIYQQELIDLIDAMPIKCKVAIFDCCESGGFSSKFTAPVKSDDNLSEIVGHGIEVLAASAGDEFARLGPGGTHSLFTEALSIAMQSPSTLRNGYRDLSDVCDYTRQIIDAWNKKNKNKQQSPVFKSSIIGNVYFKVKEIEKYEPRSVAYKTEKYTITTVKPLHTVSEKRFSVFVMTEKKESAAVLSEYTKEIVAKVRFEDVYSSRNSEQRFYGRPAQVVWCYFGCDDNDIANHNFYAHSVWATDAVRGKYYKSSSSSEEVAGIEICWNNSYAMLRSMMQKPVLKDEYVRKNKELLTEIINLAEQFNLDLERLFNKEGTISVLLSQYSQWISTIQRKYMILSDMDIPPVEIKEWSDEILNLAGDLLDISLVLGNAQKNNILDEREIWLVKNALSKYYSSLEKIKDMQPS